MKLATKTFQQAIQRVQIRDMKPPLPDAGVTEYAEYAYCVNYVVDPAADVLPINYETAHKRHAQLRANFI